MLCGCLGSGNGIWAPLPSPVSLPLGSSTASFVLGLLCVWSHAQGILLRRPLMDAAFVLLFVFLLFTVEAAVTVDVMLNRKWEEDFPDDPTGNFKELKEFIKENFEICKAIALVIVGIQGVSILFAMILKALGPHDERYYESDDDYSPDRVPLLRHYAPQPYVVSDPLHPSKTDSWNIRINSKGNK